MGKTKRINPLRKKMKGSAQKTKRTKGRNKKSRTVRKRKYNAKGGNPEELKRLRSKINQVMDVFNQHTHHASGKVKIGPANPIMRDPLYTDDEVKRNKELPGLIEDLRQEIIQLSYDSEKEQIEREQEEARKQKQSGNLKQYGEKLFNTLLPIEGDGIIYQIDAGMTESLFIDDDNYPDEVKKFREKVREYLVKSNYSVTCVEIEITRFLFETFMQPGEEWWRKKGGTTTLTAKSWSELGPMIYRVKGHDDSHSSCGPPIDNYDPTLSGEDCFNASFNRLYLNRNFIGRKIKKGEEILSMPELLYIQAFYENKFLGNRLYDEFRKAIQTAIDEYTY